MNWYKYSLLLIKESGVSGEFWITDDGIAIDASDIGDYNHEAYAIETAQYELAEDEDYEGWKLAKVAEILEIQKQELESKKIELEEAGKDTSKIDDELYSIWEKSRNPDYHAYELITDHAESLGINLATFDVAEGHGDARQYAIKVWGWKRLEGSNVETWNLTESDLRSIANGLYDAYNDDVLTETFDIYTLSNQGWYQNVPWEAIESVNPVHLWGYQTNPVG